MTKGESSVTDQERFMQLVWEAVQAIMAVRSVDIEEAYRILFTPVRAD